MIFSFSVFTRATELPSVTASLFSTPAGAQACNQQMIDAAIRGMQYGLQCFSRKNFTDRLNEFSALIQNASDPQKRILLDCRDPEHMGYRAYAHADEQPQRVEFSQRMGADVSARQNMLLNDVVVFHEFVHLTNLRYQHGYVSGLADLTLACEVCCTQGSTLATSYVDNSRMTPQDYIQQCSYCANPQINDVAVEMAYRKRMYELAIDKNRPLLFSNLVEALSTRDEATQRRYLTVSMSADFCEMISDGNDKVLSLLNTSLVTELRAHGHCQASEQVAPGSAAKPTASPNNNEEPASSASPD